jgi:hypothetical protein
MLLAITKLLLNSYTESDATITQENYFTIDDKEVSFATTNHPKAAPTLSWWNVWFSTS